jgi:hypothetical protein
VANISRGRKGKKSLRHDEQKHQISQQGRGKNGKYRGIVAVKFFEQLHQFHSRI